MCINITSTTSEVMDIDSCHGNARSLTLTGVPDGSTHCLMVSVKGSKVRIESHSRKWWKLMGVKRHAGGLSLQRDCFSGEGAGPQHGSAGAYAPPLSPPLIPPTHAFSFSFPSPLLPRKWQIHIKSLEAYPVAFWGLTFIK